MLVPLATVATEWIAAGAAVAAVLGAVVTVVQARRAFRRNAAYHYVGQLETPEFRAVTAEAGAFFSCKEPPPGTSLEDWQQLDRPERERRQWARWEQLIASWEPEDRTKVLTILALPNQLEDIAGAYNLGLIDRTVVKTHIEYFAETFWDQAKWWLNEVRRDENDNTYQDLAMMLPHLRRRRRPRWHRPRGARIKRTIL